MGRYRLEIDVCWEDDADLKGVNLSKLIKECMDSAVSAARLEIPTSARKVIAIEHTDALRHPHYGDSNCSGCINAASDGKGQSTHSYEIPSEDLTDEEASKPRRRIARAS